jgi:Trypsin
MSRCSWRGTLQGAWTDFYAKGDFLRSGTRLRLIRKMEAVPGLELERPLERLRRHNSIVTAIAGVVALLSGPTTVSAQTTIDLENRYSHVGVIMVWRVDSTGTPVELRGFASGTLIRDRVMVTAGHFTAPAKALGTLPPSIRIFASFSPTDAKDPKTWIPVVRLATHPSMPPCPPPPQCDPTDEILVAPLEPGIADVGLVFLAHPPRGIRPARLAEQDLLERSEGMETIIVGYGTTTPRKRQAPPDIAMWDGMRRIRTSVLRRVIDETWALWAIPSHVCSGDSGGGIFLDSSPNVSDGGALVANVSDGGRDCRRHNNNNRLDTRSIQDWINDTLRQGSGEP